jgi:LL-diaminopimelate aminotransferase
MALLNEHYLKLPAGRMEEEVARKVSAFAISHPKIRVIDLSGDNANMPLPAAAVKAIGQAAAEMGQEGGNPGYGPLQGYAFLREAIVKGDFLPRGIHLDASEVFVNDGASGDIANLQELLRWDNNIGVTDPVYPRYIDSNAMIGRAGVYTDGRWSEVTYFPCEAANGFVPTQPKRRVDMIYLCSPCNPTGAVLPKGELRKWVNYALRNDAILFFDATYEAYISDKTLPHSIYEIKGARKCAIEFRSYSMSAGFGGLRCGYTVIPRDLTASTLDGLTRVSLHSLWQRRLQAKAHGTSYVVQRAAEALYTPEGRQQSLAVINRYLGGANLMVERLKAMGYLVYGGVNAPYVWVEIPGGGSSWRHFEQLLYSCGVVCAPGVCFGQQGEGYFRLSSFAAHKNIEEAMDRIEAGKAL